MDFIQNIKKFLKLQSLNWTGEIILGKEKDFRPATLEDFSKLQDMDFRINFGTDGEVALSMEIDLINFKINGETFDIVYTCYAGDNEENKSLCEERDLSTEWVKYQLKQNGLVYNTMLRKKCEEEKLKIQEETKRKEKQLERKIKYLKRSIDKTKENSNREITKLEYYENLAKEIELSTN